MTSPSPRALVAGALAAALACAGCTPPPAAAGGPVEYELRFPGAAHHVAEVQVTFPDLDPLATLEVRMGRSSPGRYALHEFAKNVFDVRATDGAGAEVEVTRPNPHQWDVSDHDGTAVVSYRIFGDRVDGTYLGIDPTHAHMNIPATLMWARGLEDRGARVRLVAPEGSDWQVASQLFPTDDATVLEAPNLQYLMDSPTEFGETSLRSFDVDEGNGPQTIRVAVHHQGGEAAIDRYANDVRRIVEEMTAVFGELPRFDGGTYTFIADYLPWASGDGMEHRNSTILTSSGSIVVPQQRIGLLGTVSHEFFHAWNVERIRPAGLEPFDFEEANMSSELWLAEGFTSYYGSLVLQRAGLADLERTAAAINGWIRTVSDSPGRQIRSAVEMSRLAPFVDAARPVDPTYWTNTFISYYTWGAAIGLGLDLTLRERSRGAVTLDDYMRALWERFGRPGGPQPGVVANPYTMADARRVLGEVAGDAAFADEFFDRFIEGHEVVDYEPLLLLAGLQLRERLPGHASLGNVAFDFGGGSARLASQAPLGSPLYEAGLDQGDVLLSLDGDTIASREQLDAFLGGHAPGDQVTVRFLRRDGEQQATLTLAAATATEVVPLEETGRQPSDAQIAFREAWLGSRQ